MRTTTAFTFLIVVLCGLTAAFAGPTSGSIPVTTKSEEARELFLAARTAMERFHHAEAREGSLAAIEKDPDFAMAHLMLSAVTPDMAGMMRAQDRAIALADQVSPGERLLILASQAEHEGRLKDAQRHLEELTELHPEDARAWNQLGMSFWMTDSEAAVKFLRKAVDLDPKLDVAWNMLGYALHDHGPIDQAVAAHQQYVRLLPDEPNAHDSLAETLLRAGRFDDSIAEYEKALELDDSFNWSRAGIGHNLVFLGRYEKAAEVYEEVLSRADTPREKYRFVDWPIVCAVYAGDTDAALDKAWRKLGMARSIGALEEASALTTLARIELWAGSIAAAEATARRVPRTIPADADEGTRTDIESGALRVRIEARVDAGDGVGAGILLERLRAMIGEENLWLLQAYRFVEGYAYLEAGWEKRALEALRGAFDTDARVLFHRAEALEEMERFDDAVELWTRIARMNSPSLSHALVLERARDRLER